MSLLAGGPTETRTPDAAAAVQWNRRKQEWERRLFRRIPMAAPEHAMEVAKDAVADRELILGLAAMLRCAVTGRLSQQTRAELAQALGADFDQRSDLDAFERWRDTCSRGADRP